MGKIDQHIELIQHISEITRQGDAQLAHTRQLAHIRIIRLLSGRSIAAVQLGAIGQLNRLNQGFMRPAAPTTAIRRAIPAMYPAPT